MPSDVPHKVHVPFCVEPRPLSVSLQAEAWKEPQGHKKQNHLESDSRYKHCRLAMFSYDSRRSPGDRAYAANWAF